jgi:hypothetical protein
VNESSRILKEKILQWKEAQMKLEQATHQERKRLSMH